jgi:Tol biopolymer transport system component
MMLAIDRSCPAGIVALRICVPFVLGSFSFGAAAEGTTKLISSPLVYDPVNHYGTLPAISGDGRYVAFASYNALAPGDVVDAYADVYVKDLLDDSVERVSVNSAGSPANNHCNRPSISADGRFIAFDSPATNLVLGDTNDTSDVFLHDRLTGTTERISVNSSGAQGNAFSYQSTISGNGRFISFTSEATNLAAGVTSPNGEVYVRDRVAGTTEIISVGIAQPPVLASSSHWPAISVDGRYVAFTSNTRYELSDVNGQADVFVRDRVTGTLARASVDAAGFDGNGANHPTISANGRFVAFQSGDNLVAGDTNGTGDVFVKDMLTGALEWVSVDGAGAPSNGWSYNASISGDGRYVAFSSFASNLVSGDTNGSQDIFRRDRQDQTTELVSVGIGSAPGNADSGGSQHSITVAINTDGDAVAFTSAASNLVVDDLNNSEDVFVRSWLTNTPPTITCLDPIVLWEPNHELVDVRSVISVEDADGDELTLTFTVLSDEPEVPETGDGSGRHAPDFKDELCIGGRGLLLRSERRGTGNGRFYLVIVGADDGNGGFSEHVCVAAVAPHDQNTISLALVLVEAMNAASQVQAAIDTESPIPTGLYLDGVSVELGPFQ